MTNIRFRTETLAQTEQAALEQYASWVNQFESDCDVAMEELATLEQTADDLESIIVSAEGLRHYTDSEINLIRISTDAVLEKVGLSSRDLKLSTESGGFTLQGFKEMLRRIWRAIKATVARIWDFLHKGFSQVFAEHRRIASQIADTRVSMHNLRSALPGATTVDVKEAKLVTNLGRLSTYREVAAEVQQFVTTRTALLDRYAVKLAVTVKALLHEKAPLNMADANVMEAMRVSTNKVLRNFDREAVSASFPNARVSNDETVIPVIGQYQLVIRGQPLPAVDDRTFASAARSLSIDLSVNASADNPGDSMMTTMSFSEIEQLLKTAETLVNGISRGQTAERSRRIEDASKMFDRWVNESAKVAEDWATKDEAGATMRQEAIQFFREQASFCTAVTHWGGPVFLKMDTLGLRVAAALVNLCQAHLRTYA